MEDNGDRLVKAISLDKNIHLLACTTTKLSEEARQRHDLFPIASAALGRLMAGTLMLASLLKGREKIVTAIKATGPLGGLSAEARPNGTVRGMVYHPHVHLPSRDGKLAVGPAVGGGFLYVTRFLEEAGNPYQGVVDLVSGEISQDLTYYLATSEQTPSAVSLGVYVEPDNSVSASGGVMIQALPATPDADLALLEQNMTRLQGVSAQIRKGAMALDLLRLAAGDLPYKISGEMPLKYHCSCRREMVLRSLRLLSEEDLEEMIAEGKDSSVSCQFCGRQYLFAPKILKWVLERKKAKAGDTPA